MHKVSYAFLDKNIKFAWTRWVKLNPLSREGYEERKERFDGFIEKLIESAGWTFEEYRSDTMLRLRARRDAARAIVRSLPVDR